jgi:hypothetical protein
MIGILNRNLDLPLETTWPPLLAPDFLRVFFLRFARRC